MDVYVESNFVLELSLLQEQHESCEKIIELCEDGQARLVIPAYSLVEPHETIIRYAKNRSRLSNELATEVRQLSRSKPYQEEADTLQKVTGFLIRSQEEEKTRLSDTIERLLRISEVIPLDSQILVAARQHQLDHGFSPQDSIVYTSVLSHLSVSAEAEKCFLNRNSKDFDDPDIVEILDGYGCKMLFSFDHGYSYITSRLSSSSSE
jgi:predicted nucleic acid-binding protein